ncbi:hypothetical protein MMC12_004565 [Toensbergia leucococca]|nr:hypothetical protein [Toensbergia leucococca]
MSLKYSPTGKLVKAIIQNPTWPYDRGSIAQSPAVAGTSTPILDGPVVVREHLEGIDDIQKASPSHPSVVPTETPIENQGQSASGASTGIAQSSASHLPPIPAIGSGFGYNQAPLADYSQLLSEQRKDIDRILASVEGLKNEMNSMQATIAEMKAQSIPSAHLFKSVQDTRHATVSTKDFDRLTKSVVHTSSKASEVDALKLQLEMMKHRIKCLEEASETTQSIHVMSGPTQGSPQRLETADEGTQSTHTITGRTQDSLLCLETANDPTRSTAINTDLTRDPPQRLEVAIKPIQSAVQESGLNDDSPRMHQFARMRGSLARRPMRMGKSLPGTTVKLPKSKASFDLPVSSMVATVENESNDHYQDHLSLALDDEDELEYLPEETSEESDSDSQSSQISTRRPSREQGPQKQQDRTSPMEHPSKTQPRGLENLDAGQADNLAKAIKLVRNPNSLRLTSRPQIEIPSTPTDPSAPSTNQPNPSPHSSTTPHPALPLSSPSSNDSAPPRSSGTHTPGHKRGTTGRKPGHRRKTAPLNLPTPEWEKPDWAGPSSTTTHTAQASSSTRGRIIRRAMSGGFVSGPSSKRRKTTGAATPPEKKMEDAPPENRGAGGDVIYIGRRDEEGYRLRADGKRDMRSVRMKAAGGLLGKGKKEEGEGVGVGIGGSEEHVKLMRKIFPGREW